MNLVHDTIFRRARAAAARTLHAVDSLLWQTGRSERRVLFEAASPLSLAVFRPVLARLQRDPRLEFWFTTSDRWWDAEHTFAAEGIASRVITPEQARRLKFDGYVNADFWNTTWLPTRTTRIHLFHGVAGKYELDAPVRIAPVVRSFDRLMFANADRLHKYVEAGLVEPDGPQAQLVGYPKVDCLVDGTLDRRQLQEAFGLDPSRPTVLYAPTWSAHSSLNSVGVDLLAALAALDVNVIVKLHDRSFDARSRPDGSVDWRHELDTLCRAWRVHAAKDGDISRYLFVSDVLITDHSSAGFEFMLLDRPIVVIDCPDLIAHARVARDKVGLLRGASIVVKRDSSTITRAVERALARPAAGSAERRAAAARMFYRPGSATARAVQCIYDALDIRALAVDGADVPVLPAPSALSSRTAHHV
ncbi:MAG TPA: CDP-glycerol glycerophosphotransferase family protein [Vicinamibacterales bacterium]|nr:CDP-glycerol glycerophosphotransferase family protein [Vicinamibacterales bacterium]